MGILWHFREIFLRLSRILLSKRVHARLTANANSRVKTSLLRNNRREYYFHCSLLTVHCSLPFRLLSQPLPLLQRQLRYLLPLLPRPLLHISESPLEAQMGRMQSGLGIHFLPACQVDQREEQVAQLIAQFLAVRRRFLEITVPQVESCRI